MAWLAALTFPLACPPGTSRQQVAEYVATHLTPARFASYAGSRQHRLLVAEVDNGAGPELLGYALLHLGRPGTEAEAAVLAGATASGGPYVELSKIYAHPRMIGNGLASELMRGAIAASVSLATDHRYAPLPLWLGTNEKNDRAQAFYRKHGFAVVGRRTYDVGGQQHDDVVMLRRG